MNVNMLHIDSHTVITAYENLDGSSYKVSRSVRYKNGVLPLCVKKHIIYNLFVVVRVFHTPTYLTDVN